MIRLAFDAIADEEGREGGHVLARDATFGTLTMLEGMWVDYMSNKDDFSREVAASVVCRFIAGLFPRQFTEQIEMAMVSG